MKTLIELKADAYDCIRLLEQYQLILRDLNRQIAAYVETSVSEISEEVPAEETKIEELSND